jgi:hypothetical protein
MQTALLPSSGQQMMTGVHHSSLSAPQRAKGDASARAVLLEQGAARSAAAQRSNVLNHFEEVLITASMVLQEHSTALGAPRAPPLRPEHPEQQVECL